MTACPYRTGTQSRTTNRQIHFIPLPNTQKAGSAHGAAPSGASDPLKNAKDPAGKFTRAGSVLGRDTEDVNDHYTFHEVRHFLKKGGGHTRFFLLGRRGTRLSGVLVL